MESIDTVLGTLDAYLSTVNKLIERSTVPTPWPMPVKLSENEALALALAQIQRARDTLFEARTVPLTAVPRARVTTLLSLLKEASAFASKIQSAHMIASDGGQSVVNQAEGIAAATFDLTRSVVGLPLPENVQPLVDVLIKELRTQVEATGKAAEDRITKIDKKFGDLMTRLEQANQRASETKELETKLGIFRQQVDTLERDVKADVAARADKLIEAYENRVSTSLSEAGKARQRYEELEGDSGLSSHARTFDLQAKYHEKAQRHWLIAAIGATVAAMAWLWVGPYYLGSFVAPFTGKWHDTTTVLYVFTASILFGIAIYCARVFRAERHNMIINHHRRNGLRAYKAITKGLGDAAPGAREAVVLEVTRTIFSQQATGYQPSNAPADNVPLPIFAAIADIAKNVTKPDGK